MGRSRLVCLYQLCLSRCNILFGWGGGAVPGIGCTGDRFYTEVVLDIGRGVLPFDTKTLWAALMVSNLLFGAIMLTYAGTRAERWTLRLWASGQVIKGLGILLVLLKPMLPSIMAPMGNSLVFVGYGVELLAFVIYSGRPGLWRGVLVLAGVAVVAYNLAYLRLGRELTAAHMALLFSFGLFVFTAGNTLVIAMARRKASPVQSVLVLSNATLAVSALVRTWYAATSDQWLPGANLAFNQILFAIGYVSALADGFAFLLLVKEDSDRDLMRLATTDALTGVSNRRDFMERTETAWRLHLRLGLPMSLVMLDLDHFKTLNDRHGHAIGDAALRLTGEVLRHSLREVDICGRLGGEEFALALPGSGVEEARAVAERLRQTLAALGVETAHGPVGFTASFGVAAVCGEHGVEQALSQADRQLYQAKAAGRNQVS